MSPLKKVQMPRRWVFHHPVQPPDISFPEDACGGGGGGVGLCHAFGIDVWPGPGSFSFVKESKVYLRNSEHTALQGDQLFTSDLDLQKQGFRFLIKAWHYVKADCSPVMMLFFLQQHLCSIRMGQYTLDQRHVVGALWSGPQHPGITGSRPGLIYFSGVSFPLDMSCSFFTSPVNSFLSFLNKHICLLLTNNQSDWCDSWYNQMWRSRIFCQCSEGIERQTFFFLKKK